MLTKYKFRTLLDRKGASFNLNTLKELLQHLDSLGTGHKSKSGELFKSPSNQGRVVRFHMMNDKVIGLASAESLLKVSLPLIGLAGIGRIKNSHLIVQNDIRVVSHSLRNYILTLKKIQVQVINSDILYLITKILYHDI